MSPNDPQYGAQQLVVSLEPVPGGLAHAYTLVQMNSILARPVSQLTYGGGTHYCTWAKLSELPRKWLDSAVVASPYPNEPRLEQLDLTPSTLSGKGHPPSYIFRVYVAPFCFGSNQAFWNNLVVVAPPWEDPDEVIDISLAGYTQRLATIVGASVTIQPVDACTLQLSFADLPTLALMQQIAAMPQTNLVKRVPDGQMIIPPSAPTNPPGPPQTS